MIVSEKRKSFYFCPFLMVVNLRDTVVVVGQPIFDGL